jgi:ADP-ribosylglycohydrolase
MLYEMAIGDAYGAAFEYAPERFLREHHTLERYASHPRWKGPPGRYTDDTQMSLAIAELLVEGGPWSPRELANRFVQVFKRDPRPGYARGFQAFLESVEDGSDFLRRIKPDSDKSGAAMRAGPIGLLPHLPEVKHRAEVQARVTHDTTDGANAAIASALLCHYCAHGLGPLHEVGVFLADHVPGDWATPWSGKVGPQGWMAVRAATTALAQATSQKGLLQACVDFTGDVDTVAAVALGAGATTPLLADDLPQALRDGLETGPFGQTYLRALDLRVLALKGG